MAPGVRMPRKVWLLRVAAACLLSLYCRKRPMTPWQNRLTALTKRMAEDNKLRNYSPRTIDTYTWHVGRFAQFPGRSPESTSCEDVRSFQLHLIEKAKRWVEHV